MNTMEIRKVVIAGGGTAGWLAAAALSQQLGDLLDITLVESEEIGTVGVGEASIPPMRVFHKVLTIDEQEFMRATEAVFKLGIWFRNWGKLGHEYIHSFGTLGKPTWMCDFHHFWLHGRTRGIDADLGEYCLELEATRAGRFATSPKSEINYAYHLDAGLYAKFLRKFAEARGTKRIEGKIREVRQNSQTGNIEALGLDSGTTIAGDLFIDCTGFRGLLIEQTLKTGYEDWSHWLPCDSALAVQTESVGPANPFTSSTAHEAGWRWHIPLQHRVGNGMVYCSRFISDDDAKKSLLQSVQGKTLIEPRLIRFKTGRRLKVWNRNVVALGLASGFVEPLESTSIHLIMTGVTRLMQLFPFSGITQGIVDRFNEESCSELESIRDFIVLHYKATVRDDTPFWRHCRDMQIPDSLTRRIDLFKGNAFAWQADGELFRIDSWVQVMTGQGIMPEHYHQFAALMHDDDLARLLAGFRASVRQAVERLPRHQDFVNEYCKPSGR
jgi:tryptophan 7-halogenase